MPSSPQDKRVEVRASSIHGQGIFARETLPRRRKLGELNGELVRLPEARRNIESSPRIYFIELSRRYALDCSRGNHFKYLNHSCTPNCYLRIYRRRVEVYTSKEIAPGMELTVDYGITPHKGGMHCNCGAPGCKQRL